VQLRTLHIPYVFSPRSPRPYFPALNPTDFPATIITAGIDTGHHHVPYYVLYVAYRSLASAVVHTTRDNNSVRMHIYIYVYIFVVVYVQRPLPLLPRYFAVPYWTPPLPYPIDFSRVLCRDIVPSFDEACLLVFSRTPCWPLTDRETSDTWLVVIRLPQIGIGSSSESFQICIINRYVVYFQTPDSLFSSPRALHHFCRQHSVSFQFHSIIFVYIDTQVSSTGSKGNPSKRIYHKQSRLDAATVDHRQLQKINMYYDNVVIGARTTFDRIHVGRMFNVNVVSRIFVLRE